MLEPSPRRGRRRRTLVAGGVSTAFVLGLIVLAACSSDDKRANDTLSSSGSSRAPAALRTTTPSRPPGPAADLSQELTAGTLFIASPQGSDLTGTGYEAHEYLAAGTAISYQAGTLSGDGRWAFTPAGEAPYRTRILVRRPSDPARFNGTVAVEWLNVSGGVDADPEWATLHEEIVRSGAVWVGVSAQVIGVEGGPVLVSAPGGEGIAGTGLKAIDPARYGSLSHPGDGFSFDIFTQVARALRSGGNPLGGLTPERVLALGESQSAYAMVTYVNGVQPLTKAFDGFFVHSRGAFALPLVAPGESAELASALAGTPTIFRTDTEVPILDVQTETDVASLLNSQAARQADTDRFRLWEVAGTAHADAHLLGATASKLDCGTPVNDGPMHVVAKAALRALDSWARGGQPPPTAPRLDLTAEPSPMIQRDANGIASGGVRTPLVDVPAVVVSGAPGPNTSILCLLLGSTTPLPAGAAAAMYSSPDEYQNRYDDAVDATIRAGFALDDDRAALEAFAKPDAL
jgi:Alpha/beta hydrolase domain